MHSCVVLGSAGRIEIWRKTRQLISFELQLSEAVTSCQGWYHFRPPLSATDVLSHACYCQFNKMWFLKGICLRLSIYSKRFIVADLRGVCRSPGVTNIRYKHVPDVLVTITVILNKKGLGRIKPGKLWDLLNVGVVHKKHLFHFIHAFR